MSDTHTLPKGLTYTSDDDVGYTRVRRGRGFSYLDEEGNRVTDMEELDRIKALGIPPIWTDVWIAQDKSGHLQSTGFDPKKRKQYLYHVRWNQYRNEAKFRKMTEFGFALPDIRQTTLNDLSQQGWPKRKVLALVIQMLDEHHIRIGNEYYRQQNETFGLTTMRRKHLDFEKGVGHLEYKAKSGKYRKIDIEQGKLAKLVKECADLPGYEIFKYKGEDKKYHHINSHDVNEYLQAISQEEFTCKDFRTWGGTTIAIDKYEEAQQAVAENTRLNLETTIIKLVAKELGNTVSICRDYYIHPQVLKVLVDGDKERYEHRKLKGLPRNKIKLLRDSEVTALNIMQVG